MAKVNKTKYAILGVLNLKPCSGYDIKKFCDQSIAHFWNENYGHIYPVLKQLEANGWVTKKMEINEGKPPRNVYSITETGKKELIDWLLQPSEVPQARYEFLLKMFFSKDIPAEKVIERLKGSKEFCRGLLNEYLNMEESMKQQAKDETKIEAGLPYWYATLRYGIIDIEAKIRWCEETITYLVSQKKRKGRLKGEKDINNQR